MIDQVAVLADIDSVLAEKPSTYAGSPDDAERATRLYACVCRYTGEGTPYRKQADRFVKTVAGFGHSASHLLHGVVRALRADIAAGVMVTFEELVHADIFVDLLGQAEHLLSENFRRAAAVLAGATLEEQLRKLAAKNGVAVVDGKGDPKKASALNSDLYAKASAYQKAVHAQVDAWLKIRNDAAHGEPNFEQNYNDGDIRRMCEGIRDFITKYPA